MRMLALACLISAAAAPVHGQTRTIDRRIALAPDASIRIVSLAGKIRVTGSAMDSLIVQGEIRGAGALYMGGAGASAKLGVEATTTTGLADADLRILVPRGARVWIKTDRATVDVDRLTATVDVYTVSGPVTIRHAPANTFAESIDAPIAVSGRMEWARVKSADGAITIRGEAADLIATAVSGAIDVVGTGFLHARAETVSGTIRFAGPLDRAGVYRFETHSGDIELALPGTVHADLDLTSVTGTIVNTLTGAAPAPGAGKRGQTLQVTAGQGGAQVVARTFKGGIRVIDSR